MTLITVDAHFRLYYRTLLCVRTYSILSRHHHRPVPSGRPLSSGEVGPVRGLLKPWKCED